MSDMINMKNKSGLTISEVLISTFILALLLSVCSQILIWGMSIMRHEKGITITQNEGFKAIEWFNRDLRKTNASSFSFLKNFNNGSKIVPIAISFLQAPDTNYNTFPPCPKWDSFVIYYTYPDPKPSLFGGSQKYILIRKTIPKSDSNLLSDPNYPNYYDKVFSNYEPRSLLNDKIIFYSDGIMSLSSTNRIIARNIYEIDAVSPIKTLLSTITITTIENDRGTEIKTTYSTTVLMRNTQI